MHLAETINTLQNIERENIRTSEDVARGVLREVYVASDRPREVADAVLQPHTERSFVLPGKVVPKPVQ